VLEIAGEIPQQNRSSIAEIFELLYWRCTRNRLQKIKITIKPHGEAKKEK